MYSFCKQAVDVMYFERGYVYWRKSSKSMLSTSSAWNCSFLAPAWTIVCRSQPTFLGTVEREREINSTPSGTQHQNEIKNHEERYGEWVTTVTVGTFELYLILSFVKLAIHSTSKNAGDFFVPVQFAGKNLSILQLAHIVVRFSCICDREREIESYLREEPLQKSNKTNKRSRRKPQGKFFVRLHSYSKDTKFYQVLNHQR